LRVYFEILDRHFGDWKRCISWKSQNRTYWAKLSLGLNENGEGEGLALILD